MVRRLKRSQGSLRVGVVFWTLTEDAIGHARLSATINCDFVAHTMSQAVTGAVSDEPAVRLKPAARKVTRRKPDSRSKTRETA